MHKVNSEKPDPGRDFDYKCPSKFTLLNRHTYPQQVLLHNLVFLPEQLFHVPVDADVAPGEPLLPFLRQEYDGAGCQLDGIDQYCCKINVRGLLWSLEKKVVMGVFSTYRTPWPWA